MKKNKIDILKDIRRLISIKFIFFMCLLFAFGFTNKTDKKENANTKNANVKYYYGDVIITSADGKIPYGPTKHSLIKRTINKELKIITELVIQGKETFDTELKQINNSTKFSANDKLNSFNGFVEFTGTDWNWEKWTYDIKMNDKSGNIIGNGLLNENGIETEKYFTDSLGNKMVKIIEKLKNINQKEYNKLLNNK